MPLNFRSDNESPAAPEIMQAIAAANQGPAHGYGEDELSLRLDEAFSERFETEVRVLPLMTGTAANSIALATVCDPWNAVYCSDRAHALTDESGAPEFYGAGLRMAPVRSHQGRIDAETLCDTVRSNEGDGIHGYVPAALTLTQSTEAGTVYANSSVEQLCEAARDRGMTCHMDGARFGNAVAALDCTPADASWRAGIEMLSFGASKNGCPGAEALLFFGRFERLDRAHRLRKRGGHLLSKMRYVSAQLLAYLEDDLWLNLAGHANQLAARFAASVQSHPNANLEYPVQANEVFVRWNAQGFERLQAAGIEFLMWPGQENLGRFVFSHCSSDAETDALISAFSD